MFGNFSFWEIPLLLAYLAVPVALVVGIPLLVVRLVRRSRGPSRAELAELDARIARLEAGHGERLDDAHRRARQDEERGR